MSDMSQGPGWWQTSDGKWYPPEQAPGAQPPAAQPPPAPGAQPQPAAGFPPPAPGAGTDVIDVGQSISYGWEAFKKYPGPLIAAFAIVAVVSGLFSILASAASGDSAFLGLLLNLVSWIVAVALAKGLVTIALDVTYGREPDLSKLFSGEHFGQFLIAGILVGLLVGFGLIFCIIPGLFAAVALQFTQYRVIDRDESATEAMGGSWELVKPQFWSLVLLILALGFINFIGLLLCLVGLLVTAPLSAVAIAHAYRTAGGQVPAAV